MNRLDLLEGLEPRNPDHADIHEDEIERISLNGLNGRGAVVGLADLVAPTGNQRLQHGSVSKVVIDDENSVFLLFMAVDAVLLRVICQVTIIRPRSGKEQP